MYICIYQSGKKHTNPLNPKPMTQQIKVFHAEQGDQDNTYMVFDSMGRATNIYICASNIQDARKVAKMHEREIGSAYYKVVRGYNGGVRG